MKINEKNLKEVLRKQKVGEPEGWDYFFGNRDSCCPGDDYAKVYNIALKDVLEIFENFDSLKDYLENKKAYEDG